MAYIWGQLAEAEESFAVHFHDLYAIISFGVPDNFNSITCTKSWVCVGLLNLVEQPRPRTKARANATYRWIAFEKVLRENFKSEITFKTDSIFVGSSLLFLHDSVSSARVAINGRLIGEIRRSLI
jgi:hypothetical protein